MKKSNYKQLKEKPKELTLEQKIDEILKLLRQQEDNNKQLLPYLPIPTPTPPYQPNTSSGWKCSLCGIIVYPNQTHFCSGGTGPICGNAGISN